MTDRLKGKVALVTAAGQGIGHATPLICLQTLDHVHDAADRKSVV